ncbi:MAG: hypothetical protein E7156_04110 [Streptococcus gallolyticus]|uniref:Uncharacterized protein n=1 Tax=Streptococcus gallolyticus TaxID=315405 RepID=A0A927XET8_9STRE|nr:hypothetical protein [Streptococcus gallolyticus]MBE6164485.1 hypothetical protein [Streptococcus gallolyticus]
MNSVEITRTIIEKFNFNISEEIEAQNGKAEFSLQLLDVNDQTADIEARLNISYAENKSYEVDAQLYGLYRVTQENEFDLSNDQALIDSLMKPLVNKFKLYVGLFSENVNGIISIPDFNFSNKK